MEKICEYLCVFSFDPETPGWFDPETVTLYPGEACGKGGVPFKAGVHKPDVLFFVGSYSIE
jgi:hypothetical protein